MLGFLVVANVSIFLLLAYLGKLPTNPRASIFIDFWGRFGVYSLWFVGFVLYTRYLRQHRLLRMLIIAAVCIDIPLFLGMAYFDKITVNPETLPFVDFWGRLAVYSFWVLAYEFYRLFLREDAQSLATPGFSKGQ
jgi:hypothetical protein